MSAPVLIMAGGTGGHVFPALAVADALRARGVPVVWLGTRQGLEARVVPEAGIPVEWVSVVGLRGKGVLRLLRAPLIIGRRLLAGAADLAPGAPARGAGHGRVRLRSRRPDGAAAAAGLCASTSRMRSPA